jgi:hypothetical protein
MEPKYITFEQAKWLKEKGYEIDSNEVLFCRDEINNIEEHQIKNRDVIRARGIGYILDDDEYRVYEQHQVVDWLRVEHGIWILVLPQEQSGVDFREDNSKYPYHALFFSIIKYEEDYSYKELINTSNNEGKLFLHFNTPQEAYSAAFDYIKNNNLI